MEVMMDLQGRVLKISYSQELKLALHVERSQLKRQIKYFVQRYHLCRLQYFVQLSFYVRGYAYLGPA